MDFVSVFSDPASWVELATLMFLEMVLGIDNLVFIAITSSRLPENRRSLGRKLGLIGALCMRVILLCLISWLASLTANLLPDAPGVLSQISLRDIILIVGGAYLVYKGIIEIVGMLTLKEEREKAENNGMARTISLAQAVGLIMVMDVVFSLDSVITAVGLVDDLPIMILAVICAVLIMIALANPISDFIENHSGIKILALSFIFMVGAILVLEGFDVPVPHNGVYIAMGFALVVQICEMLWHAKGMIISCVACFALVFGLSFAIAEVTISVAIFGAVFALLISYMNKVYRERLDEFTMQYEN